MKATAYIPFVLAGLGGVSARAIADLVVKRQDELTPDATTSVRPVISWTPTPDPPGSAKYWFAFGDSYTNTGFNHDGIQPSVENPMGNPEYPGSTSSNGENWLNYITTKQNLSLTLTYNLAKYGATMDSNVINGTIQGVPSVREQVDEFLRYYGRKPRHAPWQSHNTIFSLWAGINDINQIWHKIDKNYYVEAAISSLIERITQLSKVGAKNFVVFNVPPMERSPRISKNQTWSAGENSTVLLWNAKLADLMPKVSQHQNLNIRVVDAHRVFNMVLDDPETYGLSTNLTDFGANQTLFWGDDYHPNSKAHEVLAFEASVVLQDTGFWDV